jgi:hypothetical protein
VIRSLFIESAWTFVVGWVPKLAVIIAQKCKEADEECARGRNYPPASFIQRRRQPRIAEIAHNQVNLKSGSRKNATLKWGAETHAHKKRRLRRTKVTTPQTPANWNLIPFKLTPAPLHSNYLSGVNQINESGVSLQPQCVCVHPIPFMHNPHGCVTLVFAHKDFGEGAR